MDPDVCLEAKTIDDGEKTADTIERGSGHRPIRKHVASTSREDSVDCRDGVCWSSHGDGVEGLHQSRGRCKEGGVDGAACGGYDLSSATEDCFGRESNVCKLELAVSYRCKS